MDDLLEFLALVKRELGADDARAELGGRDPDGDQLVWCTLPGGFRIVAVFEGELDARSDAQARLETLVDSFAGIGETLAEARPKSHQTHQATRALNEALERLATRAGAQSAVVVDDASPVLWASSLPQIRNLDVLSAFAAAEGTSGDAAWVDAASTAQAISRVRAVVNTPTTDERIVVQEDDLGFLARGFGGIYVAILAFGGGFSELHAEGALVRMLPAIEQLVGALPTVEPPDKGGRVIRLPLRPRKS